MDQRRFCAAGEPLFDLHLPSTSLIMVSFTENASFDLGDIPDTSSSQSCSQVENVDAVSCHDLVQSVTAKHNDQWGRVQRLARVRAKVTGQDGSAPGSRQTRRRCRGWKAGQSGPSRNYVRDKRQILPTQEDD